MNLHWVYNTKFEKRNILLPILIKLIEIIIIITINPEQWMDELWSMFSLSKNMGPILV